MMMIVVLPLRAGMNNNGDKQAEKKDNILWLYAILRRW